MTAKQNVVTGLSAASLIFAASLAWAGGQYGPGVSDTEIKIGNTVPYSGPASALGSLGRQAEAAYFAMINEQGAVNGRKINFITRDDSYSPPKTVEQTRKLVEEDQVLLIFGTVGTPPNTAIQGYLNDNKVPQLFIASGAEKWNDAKHHPWTMAWSPTYQTEARVFGRYILKNVADAKVAVLYQNDDFGKDYIIGLRSGLGERADQLIAAMQSYETTDPTVDAQIATLQASGANVLLIAATTKFAALAIRKVYDIGWKPTQLVSYPSNSVGAVLRNAGLEEIRQDDLDGFRQGSHRSAVAGHAGIPGMAGVDEEIQFLRQYRRCALGRRLRAGADHGRGAQGMRRQSHPRERDEAGRQHARPEAADAPSRHHAFDQRRRFCADEAASIGEIRRRHLEAVRRGDLGIRQLGRVCINRAR